MNRRLYKSDRDRVIAGVAGGVAQYLDVDPTIVRVIWALLALVTGGVFFVLYIVMWIVVPHEPYTGEVPAGDPAAPGAAAPGTWNAEPGRRHRSGGGSWIFGLILVGLGLYFLAREYFPAIHVDRLWPLGLVLLGLVLLFGAVRRRPA
ncbi:MAG: PspC domain-containing protein [Candidatus Limnocylindria bacterium]